jgi:alkanesulfonate monooxygenase SsuD/methylene tetrahydromethanopterin reductase-like flavin-dependent oxidoreductase (luciferase family)
MVAIHVSWDGWLRIVDAAERLGFESVWTSDHLWTVFPGPARKTLAMWPALTAAVLHTTRVRVGQLVSPVTFRHPVKLAENAVALDKLSRGRYILGLGAGWRKREHQVFGFSCPKPGERVHRLREAVQVIRSLWQGKPAYHAGRFSRLEGAVLRPTP